MRGLICKLAVFVGTVVFLCVTGGGSFQWEYLMAAPILYFAPRIGFALPVGILFKVIASIIVFALFGDFAMGHTWMWILPVILFVIDIAYSVYQVVLERQAGRFDESTVEYEA